MDHSPYAPGAGHMPPTLAGRDEELRRWLLTLNEVRARGRRRARDTILLGPRGVGKTVLLSRFIDEARMVDFDTIDLQASRGGPSLIEYAIREIARRAEGGDKAFQRAMSQLGGVSLQALGFGVAVNRRTQVNVHPADPAASAMDLARALGDLARSIRDERQRGGLLLTVDEMQAASPDDLAGLAATLGRVNVDFPDAPLLFAGTGLMSTRDALISAGVTHPERLFTVRPIPAQLSPAETAQALIEPAGQLGVSWEPEAIDYVLRLTHGYPAHVQLLADAIWAAAEGPIIGLDEAEDGGRDFAEDIAVSTLGPAWERLPDRQREYLAALSALGGQAASREVAEVLGRTPSSLTQVREQLILHSHIYAPRHGRVAMTMPMLAPFVRQVYAEAVDEADHDLIPLGELDARAAELDGPLDRDEPLSVESSVDASVESTVDASIEAPIDVDESPVEPPTNELLPPPRSIE